MYIHTVVMPPSTKKKIILKFQNFQLKRQIYEKSIFYEESDYG